MRLFRLCFSLMILAALVLAAPATSPAQKKSSGSMYGSVCDKSIGYCQNYAWTDPHEKKLTQFYISMQCSVVGANIGLSLGTHKSIRIGAHGKFKGTVEAASINTDAGEQVDSTATVSGVVTRHKQVTVSWKIKKLTSACKSKRTGHTKLKYYN